VGLVLVENSTMSLREISRLTESSTKPFDVEVRDAGLVG